MTVGPNMKNRNQSLLWNEETIVGQWHCAIKKELTNINYREIQTNKREISEPITRRTYRTCGSIKVDLSRHHCIRPSSYSVCCHAYMAVICRLHIKLCTFAKSHIICQPDPVKSRSWITIGLACHRFTRRKSAVWIKPDIWHWTCNHTQLSTSSTSKPDLVGCNIYFPSLFMCMWSI